MSLPHKSHLLIIAHGSRSRVWNQTIEDFVSDLQEVNQMNSEYFTGITACYLEHASPSIPDALQSLSQHNQYIIAVPFFLAPGVHVQQDVPEFFRNTGQVIEESDRGIYVQCNDSNCILLPHYAEAELLAENAISRFEKENLPSNKTGLVLVYYGSKRYPEIWDNLTSKIETIIKQHYNQIRIHSVYAGDAVQFSRQPIVDALGSLTNHCEHILILPELYAVGVIQKEVIPDAISQSRWNNKVVYRQDAILPDKKLAKKIWKHTASFSSSLL